MSKRQDMIAEIKKEQYLGDGLYASFDGFMFVLRAPRSGGDHHVGLEPDVLAAFDAYRKNIENMISKLPADDT